jgi:hypothetical protein
MSVKEWFDDILVCSRHFEYVSRNKVSWTLNSTLTMLWNFSSLHVLTTVIGLSTEKSLTMEGGEDFISIECYINERIL